MAARLYFWPLATHDPRAQVEARLQALQASQEARFEAVYEFYKHAAPPERGGQRPDDMFTLQLGPGFFALHAGQMIEGSLELKAIIRRDIDRDKQLRPKLTGVVEGLGFSAGDFQIKLGQARIGASNKGLVVQLEYSPCSALGGTGGAGVAACAGLLDEMQEMLIPPEISDVGQMRQVSLGAGPLQSVAVAGDCHSLSLLPPPCRRPAAAAAGRLAVQIIFTALTVSCGMHAGCGWAVDGRSCLQVRQISTAPEQRAEHTGAVGTAPFCTSECSSNLPDCASGPARRLYRQ
eukprot:SAG22_NODE_78_length_22065_cov_7.473095_10_plen_291_part_00